MACLVCCLYRSPSGDYDIFCNCLNELLHRVRITKNPLVFFGDFNMDFGVLYLENPFTSFGMHRSIFEFTPISPIQGNSRTTTDNIVNSFSSELWSAKVVCTDISDHFGICWCRRKWRHDH